MASVAQALNNLGITEWVLRGEPTSAVEFNEMFRKVTGADENGSAIESANHDDWGVTWEQVVEAKTAIEIDEPINALREERNRRIAETDWWASSDLTMSQAQTDYRQALRDITQSYGSLDEVVWPTKPE